MLKYAPYSYSRISTFGCPRKSKYKYIQGIKPQPQNLEPLLKGGAVHHILEKFPEKSTHKLSPKYQYIVDEFVQTALGKRVLFRESSREVDIGLNTSLEPCEYSSEDAMFRGSVDYLYIEDGIIHIVDYKTGKYREQRFQEYDQLMFYALWFFIKYPEADKIRISYVYVEHGLENSLCMERKYLQNYKLKLIKSIKQIEDEENFQKNITPLCDWCDYQEYCTKDI